MDKKSNSKNNNSLVSILLLLIFFPIGLYHMWSKTNWWTWLKILINVFFVIPTLFSLFATILDKDNIITIIFFLLLTIYTAVLPFIFLKNKKKNSDQSEQQNAASPSSQNSAIESSSIRQNNAQIPPGMILVGEDITRTNRGWGYNFPHFYVLIDTETSGLSPLNDDLIELSAIRIENDLVTDHFTTLIKPLSGKPIDLKSTEVNHITDEMVSNAPDLKNSLERFIRFIGQDILLGYNVSFDMNFINASLLKIGGDPLPNDYIDLYKITKNFVDSNIGYKLQNIASEMGVTSDNPHRALSDCYTAKGVYDTVYQFAKKESENEFEFPKQIDDFTLQYRFRSVRLIKCNKEALPKIINNGEECFMENTDNGIAIFDKMKNEIARVSQAKTYENVYNMMDEWNQKNMPFRWKLRTNDEDKFFIMFAFYMSDDAVIESCKLKTCILEDTNTKDAQYGIAKLVENQRIPFDEKTSQFFNGNYKIGELSKGDLNYISSNSKYDYGRDGRTLRLVKFAGLENGAPKVNIYYK